MALLTWNHACSVGVRAMDDQHGILMDAINDLRLALNRGSGREKICDLLNQLIDFSRMHFSSEEHLMEQTGFIGLIEHRAEHHRILAAIVQASHRLQGAEEVPLHSLLSALHEGFVEHIAEMDRKYGPWLRENGVC